MSNRKMSRIENLLFSLESQLQHKKNVLKTGREGIERLTVGQRRSLTGAVRQLEADIHAIRFWFKYKKKFQWLKCFSRSSL